MLAYLFSQSPIIKQEKLMGLVFTYSKSTNPLENCGCYSALMIKLLAEHRPCLVASV